MHGTHRNLTAAQRAEYYRLLKPCPHCGSEDIERLDTKGKKRYYTCHACKQNHKQTFDISPTVSVLDGN